MANEFVFLAIIPDNCRLCARDPLKHTALLPTPRLGFTQRYPLVFVTKIHHADFDLILRSGRAMLEADLVAEHEAIVGREL